MGECAARTARSVGFIERNLKNPVTIEDISRDAEYSPWHLQRLFREETGYALKDYLRKRRLAAAARELAERDRNVLDVALDYGFGYEQSFIRAFEREFGVSPGAFKKRRLSVEITARQDSVRYQRGTDPKEKDPAGCMTGCVTGRIRHFYRPARTIIGPRFFFDFRENEADPVIIRVKDEYLRKTAGLTSPGARLQAYVQLIPGNSVGAWFAFGYDASEWQGPALGYHETDIPAHIAASLEMRVNRPLCRLSIADFQRTYALLREGDLGRFRRENDLFNYTTIDSDGLSETASRISVNLPIVELPE